MAQQLEIMSDKEVISATVSENGVCRDRETVTWWRKSDLRFGFSTPKL